MHLLLTLLACSQPLPTALEVPAEPPPVKIEADAPSPNDPGLVKSDPAYWACEKAIREALRGPGEGAPAGRALELAGAAVEACEGVDAGNYETAVGLVGRLQGARTGTP